MTYVEGKKCREMKQCLILFAKNGLRNFKGRPLEIKLRRGQLSVIDYTALKHKVEEEPNIGTGKLSPELGSSEDTICRRFYRLKITTKKKLIYVLINLNNNNKPTEV